MDRINAECGTRIYHTPYSGIIQLKFTMNKSRNASVFWYYAHGSGGGGPVTKGTIQTNRRAVFVPDCQIVSSGHIHEQWVLNQPRHRVNRHGKTYLDSQVHIQTATYKEEYRQGKTGFHTERGRAGLTANRGPLCRLLWELWSGVVVAQLPLRRGNLRENRSLLRQPRFRRCRDPILPPSLRRGTWRSGARRGRGTTRAPTADHGADDLLAG